MLQVVSGNSDPHNQNLHASREHYDDTREDLYNQNYDYDGTPDVHKPTSPGHVVLICNNCRSTVTCLISEKFCKYCGSELKGPTEYLKLTFMLN